MKNHQNAKALRYILIGLIVIALIPMLLLVTWRLYQTPMYLNMTEEEAYAQVQRSFYELNAACKEQGGRGYAYGGGVRGGCIPLYDDFQSPYSTGYPFWFIIPAENPWYIWTKVLASFLVVGGCIDFLAIVCGLFFLSDLVIPILKHGLNEVVESFAAFL